MIFDNANSILMDPLLYTFIILGIIVLGLILYFLSCFIIVGKHKVAIVERLGEYIGTYGRGWHLFPPVSYKRAGYYKLGVTEIRFDLKKEKYKVTFQILNFKKYHYEGGHDAIGIVKASMQDSKDNLSETLIKRFNSVGAKFISLEKIISK